MAYQSTNPTTGVVVERFQNHSEEQIKAALAKAHSLYLSEWSKGQRGARLAVLNRVANLIEERADALALILVEEMGKRLVEARWEVEITADIARYYAANAPSLLAPKPLDTDRGSAWVECHPIGVVLAVEPWNFPLYQLVRVAAPSIALGNPVLAKHASIVPRAALAFEKLLLDAGAPAGAWTNIFATGEQISWLLEDDRVQGVALTGSEKAGSAVAAQAARHLKKAVLELGGADVFFVREDADVEHAAAVGAEARLNVAGQACNAAKRFLVHTRIADKFLDALTHHFSSVRVGDPMDPATDMGPLCSIATRDEIAEQVNRAIRAGATLHYGGKVVQGPGAFYQPTILTNIKRENPAYFEEFFGPVAQVYVVHDDDEAIKLANDSKFGLSGAIFSADVERAKVLASRIETGSVWINMRSSTSPELPFGGIKRSGYGRELSEAGIKELANQKMVIVADA